MDEQMLEAQREIVRLTAENERLQAEQDKLKYIAGLFPSGLIEIRELAWDSQGIWANKNPPDHYPEWANGYKRILAEIESVLEQRETTFDELAQVGNKL